jgi:hypothetical protein
LPRYGWIQGFSNVREGNTGRPNMERLSHLPNSLDGLRVAFLSHFFTFSWRQPGVKGQIFAMRELRLSKSIGCPSPSSASVNRPCASTAPSAPANPEFEARVLRKSWTPPGPGSLPAKQTAQKRGCRLSGLLDRTFRHLAHRAYWVCVAFKWASWAENINLGTLLSALDI